MENNIPNKTDLTTIAVKILPPLILSVMAKIASEYKKGKRVSWLSNVVIVLLAACGSILGYWVTQYLHWKEYKMTLTIFFFGLFADKLFEFLFSKTVANAFFNYLEDMIKENLTLILRKFKNRE